MDFSRTNALEKRTLLFSKYPPKDEENSATIISVCDVLAKLYKGNVKFENRAFSTYNLGMQ